MKTGIELPSVHRKRSESCKVSGIALLVSKKGPPPLAVRRSIPYSPACAETSLQAQLVHLFEGVYLQDSWVYCVPSRLGHNAAFDAAVIALIKAQQYRAERSSDAVTRNGALGSYGRAVALFNSPLHSTNDLASEETLLTMALLASYELISAQSLGAGLTHWGAIGTVLLAHPSLLSRSELARALFSGDTGAHIRYPLRAWYSLALRSETMEYLRRDVQRRLIAEVRKVRTGDTLAVSTAVDLARSLLEVEDEDAESGLLHRTPLIRTYDHFEHTVAPWSFKFSTMVDMTAAVIYWTTRLMLFKLCLQVQELWPCSHDAFDKGKLASDQERMATNILMSRQYAQVHGFFALRPMKESLFAVWAASAGRQTLRRLPISVLRTWLLERISVSLADWNHLHHTVRNIDEASDVFAGGPLRLLWAAPPASLMKGDDARGQ